MRELGVRRLERAMSLDEEYEPHFDLGLGHDASLLDPK
jgi:hypothetical protein